VVLAVALAVVTAACGSTVQMQGAQGGVDAGLDATTGTTGDSELGGVGGTGDTTPGAAASAAAAARRNSAARTGATAASTSGGSGPGVTAKQVKVGITYVEGVDQAFAALGASAISIGDTRGIFQQMIDHINKTGGLAGRQVVPVYFAYQAAGDAEAQHQAACAAMTQDTKVLFVTGLTLGFGPTGNTLVPCLAKAGTMWLGPPSGDDVFWSAHRHFLFSPDAISITREIANLADSAHAQGFFGPGAVVGLIQVDRPEIARAVQQGLEPALARHGLKVGQRIIVPSNDSFPAAVSSAVLRFASSGVTNVMFAAPGGGGPYYFMTTAESQRYKPRYALSTWDAPSVVQTLSPASQLKGTVGQGFVPVLDVDATRDPGGTTATKQCADMYKAAGFDTANRLAVGQMYWACDTFFFARDGLTKAPTYDPAGFEQVVDAMGTSFVPAATFSSRFKPGQHDGAGTYRFLAYGDDCSCFKYVGGPRDFR
jgi:ABC-type branched-subunit amino acid transport system substrate-binding protein